MPAIAGSSPAGCNAGKGWGHAETPRRRGLHRSGIVPSSLRRTQRLCVSLPFSENFAEEARLRPFSGQGMRPFHCSNRPFPAMPSSAPTTSHWIDTAPLSEAATKDILDRFYRDGCVLVPGVLGADECPTPSCAPLADEIAKTDPSFVIRQPEEKSLAFAELFIREPILSLVRAILGARLHASAPRMSSGPCPGRPSRTGMWTTSWNTPCRPTCRASEGHNSPRPLPLIWMSVPSRLSATSSAQEDGPTEIVPGPDQLSGRDSPKENPVFEGPRS